jgi:hypothetical protein
VPCLALLCLPRRCDKVRLQRRTPSQAEPRARTQPSTCHLHHSLNLTISQKAWVDQSLACNSVHVADSKHVFVVTTNGDLYRNMAHDPAFLCHSSPWKLIASTRKGISMCSVAADGTVLAVLTGKPAEIMRWKLG